MTPEWVDAVWTESQKVNVHCNDEKFQSYSCGPFYKLTICATGLANAAEKRELEKLITNAGGTFTAALMLKKTDVLVCYGIG